MIEEISYTVKSDIILSNRKKLGNHSSLKINFDEIPLNYNLHSDANLAEALVYNPRKKNLSKQTNKQPPRTNERRNKPK